MGKYAQPGNGFGIALCDHFNLPKDQVQADVKMNTGADQVLSVTLTIMLTADDLSSIADLMPGRTCPAS